MAIRLTRIYTRSGDRGLTALVGGARVPKESARLEAYGAIDELITGWVLGRLPGDEDDVASAEHHLVEMAASGMSVPAEQRGKTRHADVSA